jgi:hypothetical protein
MFGMFTVTTAYKLGELGFSWVFHQSKKTGSRDVSRTIYIKETSEILENTWRHGYTLYILYIYMYMYIILYLYMYYIYMCKLYISHGTLPAKEGSRVHDFATVPFGNLT